jgi:hypothetical protein
VPERPGCFLGQRGKKPTFVLWGDSHGAALSPALAHEAERAGRAGILLAHNGCPPLIGATLFNGSIPHTDCQAFGTRTMELIERAPDIDTVVLVARWPVYIHGYLASETAGDLVADPLLADGASLMQSDADREALLERALDATARRLANSGKRVFVTDPIPEMGQHVPTVLARLVRFHDQDSLELRVDAYVARNRTILDAFGRLAAQGLVTRISPEHLLCDERVCRAKAGATALYADDDHLSHAGALRVASSFRPAFR